MAILDELLVKLGIDADALTGGADDAANSVQQSLLGIGGAAAGVAVGAAFAAGLTNAMDASAANTRLANQLNLNTAEAQRAGDVAGDVFSAGFGESIGAVNDALGAVAQNIGGLGEATDAELQQMTKSALALADTFEFDVNESMQAVGTMIRAGLVKDGTQALDLLTATAQKLPPAFREELPAVTKEYTEFFDQLGFTGPQMLALIAEAAKNPAFELDKLADSVKEFSLRLAETDAVKEPLKELGLDVAEIQKLVNTGRGTKAFDQVTQALKGVEDQTTRTRLQAALFGGPGEDMGNSLLALDAAGAVAKNGLDDVAGSARRVTESMEATPAQQFQSITRSAATALGDFLAPALDKVASFAKDHPGLFQGMVVALGVLTVAVGIAAAAQAVASLTMVASAGKAAAAGARAAASFALSAAKMTASMTATAVRVVAGWVVMGVQSLIQAARIALAWLIAMGPIALVIAAVIGLVALIIANWDKIKAAIAAAWNWIKEKTAAIWTAIKDFLKNHWDEILMVITGPIGILVGLIIKNWDKIKNFTTNAWNAIKNAVSNAWNSVKQAVIDGNARVVSLVKSLPGKIKSAVGNLGSLLYGAGKDVVSGLWNGIQSMGGWLFSQIWGWIKAAIPDPIERFLGISSPSKLMAETGREVAAGLALGMRDRVDLVGDASMLLADAATFHLADAADPRGAAVGAATPPGVQGAGSGSAPVLEIRSGGSELDDAIVEIIRRSVRDRGGNVQVVLGQA